MANARPQRVTALQSQSNLQRFMRELHDDIDTGSEDSDCSDLEDPNASDSESDTGLNSTSQTQHDDMSDDADQPTSTGGTDDLFRDITLTWRDNVDNTKINVEEFNAVAGPNHDLPIGSTPLDYVKLVITDDDVDIIMRNTNDYAKMKQEQKRKVDKQWKELETPAELWAFFAIMIIVGINNLPKLAWFWSSHPALGNEFIKKIMSRDRFMKILQYLHISDARNEPDPKSENYSKLCKLLPFYNDVKAHFQAVFRPFKNFAVDEALVKTKGRSGIVQYMPLKPAKRGIKFWVLATSDYGYVYNLDMYCGKDGTIDRSGMGLGYDVVVAMTRCIVGKFHHVFFDRFFTGASLVLRLLKDGIYACGTALTIENYFLNV